MSEVVFRMRFCRAAGCGSLFWVCRRCDRGQCYCSAACRQQARHKQRHAANGRYQKTERGRFSHRLRQRAYRLRRARVTDHGCPPITRPAKGLPGGVRVGAPGWPPGQLFCICCQRQGRFVEPFAWRGYRRTRTTSGERSKKYVFT
jgi:hypothetical protein